MTRPYYWFAAKRRGWGWGLPCSRQGWAVLALYVLSVGGAQLAFGRAAAAVVALPATIAFTVILAKKGEPPSWRWR